MKKALSSNELKVFWNEFTAGYTKSMERQMLPFYVTLSNLMRTDEAKPLDSLLELSVGGGLGINYLISSTPASTIVGGDISDKMLDQCKANLVNPFNKSVTLTLINNEDLSQYKDDSFRNVISNFSLQLVDNPSKMLIETRRVLDKFNTHSSCGFSVWGQPKNNYLFTCIPSILKKHGVVLPNIRSNFHLSKKDDLNILLKDAGFTNIYMEYSNVPLNFTKGTDVEVMLKSPLYAEIFSQIEVSKRESITEDLFNNFKNELRSQGGRITTESLLVVASTH